MSNEYIEYTIKIKDESSSLSERDISYEGLYLSKSNASLQQKVNEIAQRFFQQNEPEESPSIIITAKFIWEP